jgi:hypothetical protein
MNVLGSRYKETTASAFALFKLVQVNIRFVYLLIIVEFFVGFRSGSCVFLCWFSGYSMAIIDTCNIFIYWYIGLFFSFI